MMVESTPSQKLGLVGFIIGGFIGFLLRPAAFLVGQLPFSVVINLGASLKGMDRALVPIAEQSFGLMMGCAIDGAICGAIIASVFTPNNDQQRKR